MIKKTFILVILFVLLLSAKKATETKYLPVLLFKFNSTVFDTLQDYDKSTYSNIDSTERINVIVDLIKSNPKCLITIIGYSDSKEKIKDLGFKRAEKLKKILIARGIKESDIETKTMSDKKPSYSMKEINKMVSEKDKEQLRRLNRKVTFMLNLK